MPLKGLRILLLDFLARWADGKSREEFTLRVERMEGGEFQMGFPKPTANGGEGENRSLLRNAGRLPIFRLLELRCFRRIHSSTLKLLNSLTVPENPQLLRPDAIKLLRGRT